MVLGSLLAVLALVPAPLPEPRTPGEETEPPVKYTLKIGDQSRKIAEGEPLKLEGTFKDPTVTLVAEPYRDFHAQGVRFSYPRQFTFEADLKDTDAKIWTLSGNDCKVMFFAMGARFTADEYADILIGKVGKKGSKKSKCAIQLEGRPVPGVRLNIEVIGHKMVWEVYVLPTKSGFKLLVLQDSIDDEGKGTVEATEVRKLLETSYRGE